MAEEKRATRSVPGTRPANTYTNKEAGYTTKIQEPTKEQKENRKKNVNSSGPGNIPSDVYTNKDSGYTTKGNAETTRRTDKKRTFSERNEAVWNNLAADVLGDRPYDYGNYSDSALKSMTEKNPGSKESILAQRELNKRNEEAGMAKKQVMTKGADGEMKDMTFGTGNTLEDKDLYGDIPASEIPNMLRKEGLDPYSTTREEASRIAKNKQKSSTPTAPTAPSTTGSVPASSSTPSVPAGPTGKTADLTNEPTEEVSQNVNLGEGQTAADLDEQVSNEPRKTLDDIMGDYEKKYQESITATPEMKSIWSAWKNGDISKDTRNYFMADALAKFGQNIANIKSAQAHNDMWANIEKGDTQNPMENVDINNQWQDYLKTDWNEAQKQKWEGKKSRMESMANILKEADLDDYVANSKADIMSNSKVQKMAEENPTKLIHMLNTQRALEGDPTMSNMDKNALVDAKADIEQAQRMGVIDENTARSQQKILDLNIQYYDQEQAIKAAVANSQMTNAAAQLELAKAAHTRDLMIKQVYDDFGSPLLKGLKSKVGNIGTNY